MTDTPGGPVARDAVTPRLARDTSIRTILATHPETAAVFAGFGLDECGGAEGPDEPLAFFARLHHVDVDRLLDALQDAIRRPAVSSVTTPEPARHRFAPFLLASIAVTLLFGGALGLVNLARLTGTWGALPRPSVWAHAYAQIFGFVALFVMGVGYHVVPRFAATTLRTTSTRVTLALQLTGVLVISLTQLVPVGWPAGPLRLAGSLALVAAATHFTLVIWRTLRRARPSPEGYERWLVVGACWLVLTSLLIVVTAATADQVWHHLLWPAGLWGFAGSWIVGVGRRVLPAFLGQRTRLPRLESHAFLLYQAGVVGWTIGAWPEQHAPLVLARGAGAVALIVAVALLAAILGFGNRRRTVPDAHAGFERYVFAAWLWLGVTLATGPLWTLAALAAGRYGAILVLDFARHALALGFVTQMIMGLSVRIVPVFTGHALWSPSARAAAFWLLNLSVAIRGLEVIVATGTWPAAWPWIALSGPPALAALLVWAANVTMTIAVGAPRRARDLLPDDPGDAIVADLIAVPGVLETLIRHGFRPLANPVARRTVAGTVTLRQACQLTGASLDEVVRAITPFLTEARNAARRREASRRTTIPLRPV